MSLPELSYKKVWTSTEDFPTYEGSEEQVRRDNQYHPDAIKDYINEELLKTLQSPGAGKGASCIGLFPITGLPDAEDVQSALEGFVELVRSISQGAIPDGSITAAKLADLAVVAAKLAARAVTTEKLDDSAVTTVKLADSAVDVSKLADEAVSGAKIKDGAVGENKISTLAVSTPKLAPKAVTLAKLGDDVTVSALLASKELVLSSYQLCDELPPPGIPGRVMFKKV